MGPAEECRVYGVMGPADECRVHGPHEGDFRTCRARGGQEGTGGRELENHWSSPGYFYKPGTPNGHLDVGHGQSPKPC